MQKVRADAIKNHHVVFFFESKFNVNVQFEYYFLLTPSCYVI